MNPTSEYAYRLDNFIFDILHAAVTDIPDETKKLPTIFALNQNYPNPFNPRTAIEFSIPKTGYVTLKMYDLLGQEVATLVSDRLTPGNYKYPWDASGFATGVYYYKIEAGGGFIQTRKLLLIK